MVADLSKNLVDAATEETCIACLRGFHTYSSTIDRVEFGRYNATLMVRMFDMFDTIAQRLCLAYLLKVQLL